MAEMAQLTRSKHEGVQIEVTHEHAAHRAPCEGVASRFCCQQGRSVAKGGGGESQNQLGRSATVGNTNPTVHDFTWRVRCCRHRRRPLVLNKQELQATLLCCWHRRRPLVLQGPHASPRTLGGLWSEDAAPAPPAPPPSLVLLRIAASQSSQSFSDANSVTS
jgi:hypothetical protein